jgi:hypothetical protein
VQQKESKRNKAKVVVSHGNLALIQQEVAGGVDEI